MDKEYIKQINKNISELEKLKEKYQNQLIEDEEYISEYNEILKRIQKEKFKNNRKEITITSATVEIPDGFDFWFKKYYDNIISMTALCNIYDKHRIQMTTIVNKYIKLNNLENKIDHLINMGYRNPRMVDIPIGYDDSAQEFLDKCHLESFNAKEVFNSGVAKNQNQLDYLIYNYYYHNITKSAIKTIKIEFGDSLNPAIIDIIKFKFRPSEVVQLKFKLNNSTVILFTPSNYTFSWSDEIDPTVSKIINIKMDVESSVIISTDKYTNLYTNNITKNIDTNILKNKILYHKDGDENLITLAELEDEIYKIEGVKLNIHLKNDKRPKDEIYVHHYPYNSRLLADDLDGIMERLKKIGLDI